MTTSSYRLPDRLSRRRNAAHHANEPERLGDWREEVELEDRRRRNIAMLQRMAEREARERRSTLGFWRYWWRRLLETARCREGVNERLD